MIKYDFEPPWIKFPGFPPYDGFWRQAGEYWLAYEWVPYWESLTEDEKEDYLVRWQVPEVWRQFSVYLNPEFEKWLESLDND